MLCQPIPVLFAWVSTPLHRVAMLARITVGAARSSIRHRQKHSSTVRRAWFLLGIQRCLVRAVCKFLNLTGPNWLLSPLTIGLSPSTQQHPCGTRNMPCLFPKGRTQSPPTAISLFTIRSLGSKGFLHSGKSPRWASGVGGRAMVHLQNSFC